MGYMEKYGLSGTAAMDYLSELRRKILLLEGMLIETGGRFGENRMDDYINSCLETAELYYRNTGVKKELLETVNYYIREYENQKSWKYYAYEMRFLCKLKDGIEQLI